MIRLNKVLSLGLLHLVRNNKQQSSIPKYLSYSLFPQRLWSTKITPYYFSTMKSDVELAISLLNEGKHAEAIKVGKGYIEAFKGDKIQDSDYILAHKLVGIGLKTMNDYYSALPYYQAWLNLTIKKYGENHVATCESYRELGALYLSLSKMDEAKEYLKKSVRIAQGLSDYSSIELASTYRDLGQAYHKEGNFNEALEHVHKAMSIAEKEKILVPGLSHCLGIIYRDMRYQ